MHGQQNIKIYYCKNVRLQHYVFCEVSRIFIYIIFFSL